MKSFSQRKQAAARRALDVLPEEKRPALSVSVGFKPCDGCQACCFVQRIQELNKPEFSTCPHQCYSGCDVYATKPAECSGYRCAYSMGAIVGGLETRPDNLGLIIDFRPALRPDAAQYGEREDLIAIWEVWPGAALSSRGLQYITKLAEMGHNVILVPFDAPPSDSNRIWHIRISTSATSDAPRGIFDRILPDELEDELRKLIADM